MVARNPFKPSAGATPPLLVGRTEAIEEFKDSLADGPGAPGRLTIFTGARGVGKTVMLTEGANEALKEGWVAVSDTATQPSLRASFATSVSITVLPTPRAPVKIVSRPGAPGPSASESLNSSMASVRPTRSGGVAPAEGLKGFLATMSFHSFKLFEQRCIAAAGRQDLRGRVELGSGGAARIAQHRRRSEPTADPWRQWLHHCMSAPFLASSVGAEQVGDVGAGELHPDAAQ